MISRNYSEKNQLYNIFFRFLLMLLDYMTASCRLVSILCTSAAATTIHNCMPINSSIFVSDVHLYVMTLTSWLQKIMNITYELSTAWNKIPIFRRNDKKLLIFMQYACLQLHYLVTKQINEVKHCLQNGHICCSSNISLLIVTFNCYKWCLIINILGRSAYQ